MKCLSIWQPWASLIVSGLKQVETRSWPIHHRGPLLIHAAKRWTAEEREIALVGECERTLRRIGCISYQPYGVPQFKLPFGAIIGMVDVRGCWPTESVRPSLGNDEPAYGSWFGDGSPRNCLEISWGEYDLGNYESGRFAFLFVNITPFCKPIPYRGARGLFDVPDSVITGAEKAVPA